MAESFASGRLISSLPLKLDEEQITLEAILERVRSTLALARDWKAGRWRSENSSSTSFINQTTTTVVTGSKYGWEGRERRQSQDDDDDAMVDLTTYEEIVTRAKRERDTILSEVRKRPKDVDAVARLNSLTCLLALARSTRPDPRYLDRPLQSPLRPRADVSKRLAARKAAVGTGQRASQLQDGNQAAGGEQAEHRNQAGGVQVDGGVDKDRGNKSAWKTEREDVI